ncbi:amino acid transporter [Pedobacter yonginense]|uniref:Amino acid transporter n=1 Tax=Pedobacter yonginense TaxID=651869 RepID=A0A317ESD7_9SPHI|nr:amino acid permease [Pedobacter yonginense]PWS29325.1 amino acid transporter [Pedobacter yonginense]
MKLLDFRKKSISTSDGADDGHEKMNRTLSVFDLTLMGVAAVIGAGIFSTIGVASFNGGPGVSVLFIIIAITCGFSALCYAEFASRVPQSGSAYTYAYVSFGEVFAWIIGWALILEYAIGNIVVAISWSGYFNNLLKGVGLELPYWLSTGYFAGLEDVESITKHVASGEVLTSQMTYVLNGFKEAPDLFGHKLLINVPAFLIVVLITWVAYIGMQESKKVSNAMVILKMLVIALVIGVGFFYIDTNNWLPIGQNGTPSFFPNGMGGVLMGVSAVFFAYIGFDAISTTAEECKNPQRDLPRGMLYALLICTVLYILISLVLTGMVSYKELKVDDPLAYVFEAVGQNWIGYIISVSAVIATTSVLLVFQLGQPRIWMSMGRDGLLPKRFATLHPKYKTPSYSTIVTGILVGIPTLFMPSSLVTDLTSIGTLFAFVLVCLGVLALPKIKKEASKYSIPYVNSRFVLPIIVAVFLYVTWDRLKGSVLNIENENFHEVLFLLFTGTLITFSIFASIRKFNAIPILGALSCLYLMIEIPALGWFGFFTWMAIGIIIYLSYGIKYSKYKKNKRNDFT